MKTWITVPVSALSDIDWSQTRYTNADTTPKNIAGDTALVKWVGDMPDSIAAIEGKGETLDHGGALALLASEAWSQEI